MPAVSLPSRVLGTKIKKFGAILLKCMFGYLGGGYCPLCPPGYAYVDMGRRWEENECF